MMVDSVLRFFYDHGLVALTVAGIGAAGLALWTLFVSAMLKRWPNIGGALASAGLYLPWVLRCLGRAFENRARRAKGLPELPYEAPVPEVAEPAPAKTRPPTLPLMSFLALALLLAGCDLPAMVRVADGAAAAGEAARPVLRETCTDPMAALAKRVLAAKNAQDIALWSAASQEADLLARRCDPAIDAQRLLLSLHAALRAGIVAWHAGAKPPDIEALATRIGAAAAKLAESLAALRDAKPEGAS